MRMKLCRGCQQLLLTVMLLVFTQPVFSQTSEETNAPEITTEINFFSTLNHVEVEAGTSPSLSLKARGTGTLRYIWMKDDIVVKNATEDYLRFQTAVQLSDSGLYRCIVENKFGKVRSLPFILTVTELGDFTNRSDQTVSVQEGKFAVLNMPDISFMEGFVTVEWEKDGATVPVNSNNYHVSLDYDLAIMDIPMSFSGARFRVKLVHATLVSTRATESHYFILSVSASSTQETFVAPEFVIQPRNTSAVSGADEAKLECVVNGRPSTNLQIKWHKGTGASRVEITSNSKYSLSPDSRVLTISNVAEGDAGIYECEGSLNAQTVFSPITQQATLSVHVLPSVSSPPPHLVTKDFQEAFVLHCDAQGTPKPAVKWYFNTEELSSNDSRHQIFPNGTLAIESVDLPDSGVYQCVMTNAAGEEATYTQLIVNSAKPTMVEAPQDKLIAEGEDTSFTCKVKGGPQPEVYWTKDGVNLTIGNRIRVTEDKLLIGGAMMTDSGLYACHAVNIKGSISANATLTVLVKTQINKPPQNMSRILSTDVMFDCGVRSDPSVTPTWTWYFYPEPNYAKQEIIPGEGNKQLLTNGSLVIEGILGKDSGRYECVVTSDGGNDQRMATLKVIDLPGPPTITSVVLYDGVPNSVMINWTLSYDGNTQITKFVIENRRESSSGSNIDSPWETVNSSVDPSLRFTVVGQLLPSRYYRFRMIAVNSVGNSQPSDAAPAAEAIKMPAQPPGEAPLNLFCKQGQEREINVMWEPPPEATWNGDLQGYLIYYKVDAFDDTTERTKNVTGRDVRQTFINNLAYHKKYRVRMAAYNEKGPGKNSTDFYVTTLQGTPDAPPGDVVLSSPNSTTIRAQWDPPPSIMLNGINQGYEIEVEQGNTFIRQETVRFDDQNPTGRQTFDIVNLKKYTEYTIKIACRTAPGPGPQSPPKTIRTLEDVPGPVTDLKVDNIRDKSLRVNWQPPDEINGILIGYTITYKEKNSSSWLPSIDRNADTISHTLTDLSYETTYVISVVAKTQKGPGPARTTEIVSGVPPELPGPPTNLVVIRSMIEARSVMLRFDPGFDGKTSITLWIVEAQIEDNTNWVQVYNISDPTAISIKVLNLRPYTRYKLRIIAKNIVDVSEPSAPCDAFQTLQAAPGMPPMAVTPRASSPTSIRIRWMQIPRTEWNSDYLGYKILYRRWSSDVDVNTTSQSDLDLVRQKDWTIVDLRNGSTIQEHSLVNLEEWMDYQIKMISYNSVGNSSASPTLSERTEEDVPSASPRSVQPFPVSSTSIFVSWGPVPILQQNGNIQGYKVKYQAHRAGAETQFKEVEGANTLNVTLTNLRKYMEYSVQVLAYSRKGDGVLSPSITVRTAGDVPGPPIIIYFPQVSETSATILWQPPDEPNGIIEMYRVGYKRKDQTTAPITQDTKNLQYSITGLDREVYYEFSVMARTENGWGEASTVDVFTISNRDRPDPPYNLRIDSSEVFSRSVTIVWSAGNDNFGPIRNYTIQHRVRDGIWETVEGTIKPQPTVYSVTGLRPNTRYTFRVAAVNDIGRSDFSAESGEVLTLPDKPDGAPQNVKIEALTRTSIKITWEPPNMSLWNSDTLFGYYVRYKREAVQEETTWQYQYADGDEHIVPNLDPGQKYSCNVQAYNALGGGPWSMRAFTYLEIAPFDPPGNVRMVNKSSTQLEVTWEPPPESSTNGNLIGYKVLYWQSDTETCTETNPSQRSVTEQNILLNNLKPYTIYCCTVQAVNIAGEGPKSGAQLRRTSEDKPDKPTNVHFSNITHSQLTVLWDPPLHPNGKITHYELQYYVSIDDDRTHISTLILSGDDHQQEVRDLIENQKYTFTLAAINSIGKSNVTDISVVVGPQPGSPDAPTRPDIERKNKNIILTWGIVGEGSSPIRGYHISYQIEDKSDEWTSILDLSSPNPSAQISLGDLNPSTVYLFRVRAINSEGISPPSRPSEPYETPASLLASKSSPFHTQWWFLVIVALTGVIFILLLITLLCYVEKRRNKDKEMKRSTTSTTVMSATPEPEEGGFPSLELRQSRRSVGRNGKVQNNIYARSPPRPSPASVTYSEGLNLPMAGAAAAAAAKPPMSDDASSVLSEKPSNLGDSSDEISSDDSDDSTDSIAKAPVPASPPPPAFSSHFNRSSSNNNSSGAGASTSGARQSTKNQNQNPSWRFQNPSSAYAYTDSEAESSHYAFSLNNGNIVVNNVAGARTPLSGFSSFV